MKRRRETTDMLKNLNRTCEQWGSFKENQDEMEDQKHS